MNIENMTSGEYLNYMLKNNLNTHTGFERETISQSEDTEN